MEDTPGVRRVGAEFVSAVLNRKLFVPNILSALLKGNQLGTRDEVSRIVSPGWKKYLNSPIFIRRAESRDAERLGIRGWKREKENFHGQMACSEMRICPWLVGSPEILETVNRTARTAARKLRKDDARPKKKGKEE